MENMRVHLIIVYILQVNFIWGYLLLQMYQFGLERILEAIKTEIKI